MIYKNKDKIYIKVSENFVEVSVKKDKNGYTVIPTKNKIEAYKREKDFNVISLEKAYEMQSKEDKLLSDNKLLSDLDNIE